MSYVAERPIVTLCMNPALDITTSTEVVVPTDKIRCGTTRYDAGGGGVNVAHVAQVLGAAATAVFPGGGPAGEMLNRLLLAEGVVTHRIEIGGASPRSPLEAGEAAHCHAAVRAVPHPAGRAASSPAGPREP